MNSPMDTATASTTFRFRRYREEAALRSSLQQDTDNERKPTVSTDAPTKPSNSTRSSLVSRSESGDGTVIENLSNAIVVVRADGKVFKDEKSSTDETNDKNDTRISAQNDKTEQREPISVVPEGTTLLLRSLQDCIVTIHLPLPAVHFVGIENTEILFYNRGEGDNKSTAIRANTTIHMTDCRGKSSLQLETSAQQLRIHKAIGLGVQMMNHQPSSWKPGSIILEASKNVVFSVPILATPENEPLSTMESKVSTTKTYWHQVIVKDFQWLRKGIASPNFEIDVLEERTSENTRETRATENSTVTIEASKESHRVSSDESEGENCSDSEDEL